MLTQNDLRERSRIVPGQETVTFTPKTPDQAPFTVDGARFYNANGSSEFASGPVTATTDQQTWILPFSNMGGYSPKAGDVITSDGTGIAPAGDWRVTPQINNLLMQSEYKLTVVAAVDEA